MQAPTPMTPCAECGMPCTANEYHPYAACLMFKQCRNSGTVRENLTYVIEHGASGPNAALAAACNEMSCCDDVPLQDGLAAAIGYLRQQRDDLRS